MGYYPKYACIQLGVVAFDLKKDQIMKEQNLSDQKAYETTSQTFFENRSEVGKYISQMLTQGAKTFGDFCKQQMQELEETEWLVARRPQRLLGPQDFASIINDRNPRMPGVEEAKKYLNYSENQLIKETGGK